MGFVLLTYTGWQIILLCGGETAILWKFSEKDEK